MTTPNKAKGSQFERDVASYLVSRGLKNVERRYGAGAQLDRGDLNGVQHYGAVVEIKNLKTITCASILDEALQEAKNAGLDFGIAVIKRRGKDASHAYVLMELAQFVDWKGFQ